MIAAVYLPPISPTPTIPPSPLVDKSIQSFKIKEFNISTFSYIRTSSFKIRCNKKAGTHRALQDFSVLKTDFRCDTGSIWSTMALYLFSLHIPLSFGGLSVVAKLLHQTVLDPETQVVSLLIIEILELVCFVLLLRYSEKPCNILSFFEGKELPKQRNWLLASVLGLGFLLVFVVLTSFLADKLIGRKDVNNSILKTILSSSSLSIVASTLLYCVIAPVLEETVYRGFLLTSLASTMKWQKALVISSAVFSASHFSVDNFLQLFVISYVLGCSYCWDN